MRGRSRKTLGIWLVIAILAIPSVALAHSKSNTFTVATKNCSVNHNHQTSPSKLVWINSKSGNACGLTRARITVFLDGTNLTFTSAWTGLASSGSALGSYVGGGAQVQLTDAGGSISPWYSH